MKTFCLTTHSFFTFKATLFLPAVILVVATGAGFLHAQPANDLFANARNLVGADGHMGGSTIGAGKEPGEPNHAGDFGGRSIWYSWKAPASGPAAFDTVGSSFDTLLAVYTGDSVDALNLVAENDDSSFLYYSQVIFDAVQDQVYRIAIDGYSGRSGTTQLNWASSPPTNDNFSDAQVLSGQNGSVIGSAHFATKEPGEPNHAGNSGGHSIWYTWTAPASAQAQFETVGSGFDTLLAVYTGSDLQSLSQQAANDDIDFFNDVYTSRVLFDAVQDEVYWIAIDGYGGDRGTTRLTWASGPPTNDNFSAAQVLAGPEGSVSGTTILATKEFGEPNHAGNPGGNSVWYDWSPSTNAVATLSLAGSTFDTLLAVYTGDSLDALTLVAENDDFGFGLQSQVQFDVDPGVTYHIAVDGYRGDMGQFTLSYSLIVAPIITGEPQSRTVLEGTDVAFGIDALGARPLSFLWSFNQTNLDAATNATLTLTNVALSQAGDYRAVVSNPFGTATSLVAHLTVLRAESPGVQRCWTDRETFSGAALGVDNAGNLHVTGTSSSTISSLDFTTAKYAANGAILWTATYDGPASLDDRATAMALDRAGNVYVTGFSIGLDGSPEFATVKYDPDGTYLWEARFGPNHSGEVPFAVAVDDAGNVFISGDDVTVKYNRDGLQLWAIHHTNFYATAMALDRVGNVCLTGGTPTNSSDFTTAKYDTEGRLVWLATENGPHSQSDDRASVIAVDGSGNVYVAGPSSGACCLTGATGEGNDSLGYLTVKYDASGHRLWSARYTYPGTFLERVNGIGLDGTGNVFVMGESFGTVKYDADGNQLWFSRVQPENAYNVLSAALAVDRAGNAFVTGALTDSLGGPDYYTAKYETNGSVTWRARFHSEGGANAVTVDNPGNAYVTGSSATLKYAQVDMTGFPKITSVPADATVLSGANVVLNVQATGSTPLFFQWRRNGLTIPTATNATLRLANVQVSDRGDYMVDVSNAVGSVTSPSARVRVVLPVVITSQPRSRDVVVGEQVEFQVSASGSPLYYQWRLNGVDVPGATESTLRFANVLGFHAGDYTVAVTNELSGATSLVARLTVRTEVRQVWQDRFPGSGFPDTQPVAIKVDAQRNVYVTSTSYSSTFNDYLTRKYDPEGGILWSARYNGPDNNTDYGWALAVDDAGNVYVTGGSYGGTTTGFDFATVKYDAQGSQLWVARYNGPGSGEDIAFAIAVDGSGNSYVTGYSTGSGSGYDYATIKYAPDGTQLWAARYNGPGNGTDTAEAIAVDNASNVYVTGFSYGGSATTNDYATIKYSPDGNQLWVARYNGPGNGVDIAYAIVLDNGGNPHVTGRSIGSGTFSDYATIKYSTNGAQLWLARYNGPANSTDWGLDLKLDGAGNVYVTGVSYGGGASSFDYATVKYGPTGAQLWVARYNGPTNNYDQANALALDNAGNVYVTGYSYGGELTTNDIATVKYSPNGTQLWAARYDGFAHLDDRAHAIAVDSAGAVYVAGESAALGGDEFVVLKYVSNARPAIALTSPTNNSTFMLPVTIDFTVNTSDSDGAIAKVELFDFANKVGESLNPPFAISWTNPPPGSHRMSARAFDNFGATANSPSIFVNVTGINHAPEIASIPAQTVDEGTQLALSIPATDPDLPQNNLTFTLGPAAPTGAVINPATGFLTWIPSEAQGPGTNTIPVVVTDDGSPSLSTTQTVTVVVREVNTAPMLLPVGNQTANVLALLRVTNGVIDADLPANRMTFRLLPGAPEGARIHPASGVFSWSPNRAQAPSSNLIVVAVTDDGIPPLSATNHFSVLVGDYLELTLGATVLRAGQTGSVPVAMTSRSGVTNLSFLLEAPWERVTNFALGSVPADVSGTLEPGGINRSSIRCNAVAGQPLIGSRMLGSLEFTTSSNQTSAIVPLNVSSLAAVQVNGSPVPRTIANSGRVVVVGANPLLEAVMRSNGPRTLTLYGILQTTYTLESTTNLTAPTPWQVEWQGTLTNLIQIFDLPAANRTIFYRARE